MAPEHLREIKAVFYRSTGGTEPVLDWLRSLPAEDRRVIGTDLATVQFGWPIGMPLYRPLGSGLWEVRGTLPSRRIARLLCRRRAHRRGARVHQENPKDPGGRTGACAQTHEGNEDMSKANPHW